MDIDDKLSCVIWLVITTSLLGFVGFKYVSNKKQMASKLTFQEWIKKSPTTLSHLDTGNYSDSSYKGDDNNWYKLDFAARNCIEEIILSMKISNSSSCKKGTLDFFLSEYKKYNPGSALPRTLIANNTHKKIRKQTTPNSVASQTDPQSLTSNTSKDNPKQVKHSPSQTQYYKLRLDNGKTYTVMKDHLTCEIKKFAPNNNSDAWRKLTTNKKIAIHGPSFEVRCKSYGIITDLTGYQFHYSEPFKSCLRTFGTEWIMTRDGYTGNFSDWYWQRHGYNNPTRITNELSCNLSAISNSLVSEGRAFSNSFYLDKKNMKYIQKN